MRKTTYALLALALVAGHAPPADAGPLLGARRLVINRHSSNQCPTLDDNGNAATCLQVDSTGALIERQAAENHYVVAVSPAPSTNGVVPTWNSSAGKWYLAVPAGGGGSGMAIGDPVTGGAANAVPFIDPSANLAQEPSDFYYDGDLHVTGNIISSSGLRIFSSGTGLSGILSGSFSGSDKTFTFPNTTGTVPLLSLAQTWSAIQTHANAGAIRLNNSADTFYSQLATAATANRTWTLPDATATAVGLDTAQSLTAKRYGRTMQAIAAASSITIDPASGEYARVSLSGTAVTTITSASGTDGEMLFVEILQDSTGGRSISGWDSGWLLSGGAYTPTSTASAVDLITFVRDGTSSKWVEVSRRLGAGVVTAPIGEEVEVSLPKFCLTTSLASCQAGSGSFTNANKITFTEACTVYGVKIYWTPNTTRTLSCKAWDNSPSVVASGTKATAGTGTYICYFGTPVTVAAYAPYEISTYDQSGTDYSYINKSQFETSSPIRWPSGSVYPIKAGPHLLVNDYGLYRAGDDSSLPATSAANERYPLAPVYTCPRGI